MSSHRADQDPIAAHYLDGVIRWALRDSVVDAEPSPQVWEQIQRRIEDSAQTAPMHSPTRNRVFPRRWWFGWLIGAGANFPVPGDPRLAWQRRLYACDVRAPLAVVRIIEGKMPALRLVS